VTINERLSVVSTSSSTIGFLVGVAKGNELTTMINAGLLVANVAFALIALESPDVNMDDQIYQLQEDEHEHR